MKKRNDAQVFDIETFVDTIEFELLYRHKRRRIHPFTKKIIRDAKPIGDGGKPRPEFTFEHGLNTDSKTYKWFDLFLPR